jgi:hypothetical protein
MTILKSNLIKVIAGKIEKLAGRTEIVYDQEKADKINMSAPTIWKSYRAFINVKNCNFIDINARTLTHAETCIDILGIKDKVIAIKEI